MRACRCCMYCLRLTFCESLGLQTLSTNIAQPDILRGQIAILCSASNPKLLLSEDETSPPLFSALQDYCNQAEEIVCKILTYLHLYRLKLRFRIFDIYIQNMASTPSYPRGYEGVLNMQLFAYMAFFKI